MIALRIPAGDRELAADLFEPETAPEAGVLLIHGYETARGGYAARAEAVRDRLGLTALTFDLSGHGESPGDLATVTAAEHAEDVVAAYDTLAARVERVAVCGASYGAYLACGLLGERPVERLLLRAPAVYVGDLLQHLVDADSALANLRGYPGETLVLESEHDEVIPRRSIEACLAAAQHGTHHVIPGAAHALTTPEWKTAFIEEIISWFAPLARR